MKSLQHGFVFRMMFEPDRMQIGGSVVISQQWHKTLNECGVGRKIRFGDGEQEFGRFAQIKSKRDVLRQGAGRFGLHVFAVERAYPSLRRAYLIGRRCPVREFGADLRPQWLRRGKVDVVTASIQRGKNAEQGFIGVKGDLGFWRFQWGICPRFRGRAALWLLLRPKGRNDENDGEQGRRTQKILLGILLV